MFLSIYAASQKNNSVPRPVSSLQKMVETEKAFARFAEEKGTKAAFLEFLADEGIIFQPAVTNGKLFWKNSPESTAWLNWSPAWADISSDGNLGYTTGGWSFHPKGKTDSATGFGEYLTIWEKQSDGKFKAVLDIGIAHNKNTSGNKNWKFPADAGKGVTRIEKGINRGILTDIFSKEILSQGYFNYFADDVVVLRESYPAIYGKTEAFLGLEKMDSEFPPKSYLNFKADVSPMYGNMMYAHGVYQLTHRDKTISSWNFVQIWKFRNGRWQIVADVFSPIPATQK